MTIGRCAFTGRPIEDMGDGVWDDGEWISWDYINQSLEDQERQKQFPEADPIMVEVFEDLINSAIQYKELTGRHLDIFGELGELYAEIKYGLVRHRANAQGSDGRIGDDFVEVKTISPVKRSNDVRVKRSGHFNKLVVVKISSDYEFEARIIDRGNLKKGSGKFASVKYDNLEADESDAGQ